MLDSPVPPGTSGMAEWLKILLSALAGMTVATLLEPLKFAINARLKRNQVRRALYEVLGTLYDFIHELGSPEAAIRELIYDAAILRENKRSISQEEHVRERLGLWHFEIFDHYYGDERGAFYSFGARQRF